MKMTIGQMLDSLITCNIKIFMLENVKRDENANDNQIAEATKSTNKLNSQRNATIDEIDQELNNIAKGGQQKLFGSNKIYGK